MRRAPITAASLVSLTVLLAACSGPSAKPIPIPNLGVSLRQAQHFFNGMGGGGWKPGALTGGVVGYAAGDGQGHYCDVQLSGRVVALNYVLVGCLPSGASKSTPQQAATVIDATVHRFAPAASKWAQDVTAGLVANPSGAASSHRKTVGSTSVEIQQSPAGATVVIQPEVIAKAQPASR